MAPDPYRTIFAKSRVQAENDEDVDRNRVHPTRLLRNDILCVLKTCLCLLIEDNRQDDA